MVNLAELIIKILFEWDQISDCGRWFGYSALADELFSRHLFQNEKRMKSEVKDLYKNGYLDYSFLYSEEGKIMGKGYFINKKGIEYYNSIIGVKFE